MTKFTAVRRQLMGEGITNKRKRTVLVRQNNKEIIIVVARRAKQYSLHNRSTPFSGALGQYGTNVTVLNSQLLTGMFYVLFKNTAMQLATGDCRFAHALLMHNLRVNAYRLHLRKPQLSQLPCCSLMPTFAESCRSGKLQSVKSV